MEETMKTLQLKKEIEYLLESRIHHESPSGSDEGSSSSYYPETS
jgi:hypothetical protein